MFPELLGEIDNLKRPQIIFKIKESMQQMKKAKEQDYWISAKGQDELKKMNGDQTRKGLNYLRLRTADQSQSMSYDCAWGRVVRGGAHCRHRRLRHGYPETDVSTHTHYPVSAITTRNGV